MEAHRQYTSELRDKFGYLATWAPNMTLHLGDVGTIEDRTFVPMTTLARLGIEFETRESNGVADYEYVSSGSVAIKLKTAGEAPIAGSAFSIADAGITIQFGSENAILFHAAKCRESMILGVDTLGKQLIKKNGDGEWPLEYVVVTSVVSAKAATVLISAAQDAEIELVTKAGLGPTGASLAHLEADVHVANVKSLGLKIVAGSSLTPLFRAGGLRKALLRNPKFKSRGNFDSETQPAAAPDFRFTEVDYSDLEEA